MKIILYVLDSLRADHLSCYGYERLTSSNIDKLAQEGVIFENAYSQSTWTRCSAASILTGTYPSTHQTRTRSDILPPQITTLPKLLQKRKFKTAGFSAMGNVSTIMGFDNGFDEFYDLYKEPSLFKIRQTSNATREKLYNETNSEIVLPLAEDLNNFVLPWLKINHNPNFFLFIWSIDTHDPYFPPKEFEKFINYNYEGSIDGVRGLKKVKSTKRHEYINHLINLYDSEIYYNDYQIGNLIEELKKLDIYDDTMFIVTSDHGKSWNDYNRGVFGHGGFPYEEVIRVPLIIKFPYSRNSGRKVSGFVQLIDIVPTILSLLDSGSDDVSNNIQGVSLLPLIERQIPINEYVYSENQMEITKATYISIRSNEWKYVLTLPPKLCLRNFKAHPRHFLQTNFLLEREKLFNLKLDKTERVNWKSRKKSLKTKLKKKLYTWLEDCQKASKDIESKWLSEMDRETEAQLRELGYLD